MRTLRSLWLWGAGGLWFALFLIRLNRKLLRFTPQFLDPWIKRELARFFRFMGCQIIVRGHTNLSPGQTYLFMANHVSLFDVPLLKLVVPGHAFGIQAEHQFHWPLFGTAIKRLGSLPLKQDDPSAALGTYRRALKLLRRGQSLILLPEGHRTLDGKLGPFMRLPFWLAHKAGVPIVPIVMEGLFTLKPKTSWHITPTRLRLTFEKPLPAEVVRRKSPEYLRARVRQIIQHRLKTAPPGNLNKVAQPD